mmetsp:Transcript_11061/g.36635  ORF Transcript_11061/g.36635 Transcript_11061/m.36635 type:complete len:83 (+) Transcript_11061:34-282(+)
MAFRAGLRPGDIVLSVNGVSGLSATQLVETLRVAEGSFTLVVISEDAAVAEASRKAAAAAVAARVESDTLAALQNLVEQVRI